MNILQLSFGLTFFLSRVIVVRHDYIKQFLYISTYITIFINYEMIFVYFINDYGRMPFNTYIF